MTNKPIWQMNLFTTKGARCVACSHKEQHSEEVPRRRRAYAP